MRSRSAPIATAGLPPRPPVTEWRWLWPDASVVSARTHWANIARRIWTEARIMYPDRFDAVEISPILVKSDGPDQIEGVHFRVALYPHVFDLSYTVPRHGPTSDSFLAHLGRVVEAAHRYERLARWMRLKPIQPRCPYDLWWNPRAMRDRLMRLSPLDIGPPVYSDPR